MKMLTLALTVLGVIGLASAASACPKHDQHAETPVVKPKVGA